MFRALIVDDEPIAIDSIEYIIKQNLKEIEIAGRARSGREAVEKAYHVRPDIVLIDIKMPGINGLEAIRQIRGSNPDVHVIIISAYDYFDYATEALALGVDDYLLKPVKEIKLIEVMRKAIDTINQRRNQISQELALKEKFEMVAPILENGFINSICMFEDNSEEIRNFSRLFSMEDKGGYIIAFELSDRDFGGSRNKISASVKSQHLYEDYRDILKSACQCIIGPVMLNRLIVYVLEDPSEDGYEIKATAERHAKNFSEKVSETFGEVAIGIGRFYSDVKDAQKSYREAMKALRAISGSMEENAILHIDDLIEDYNEDPDYDEQCEKELYPSAVKGDFTGALTAFENIFAKLCAISLPDFDAVKNKSLGLIVGFGKRWNMESKVYYLALNRIIMAQNTEELRAVCRKFIEDFVGVISSGRQKRISSIIRKADEFLYEHYAEEITLDDIARVVNLSPFYFSRLYKEESGVNFIDRLMTIRIDKAKEYFLQSDLSVKEVSMLVGYSDPNYFSKLFKKLTGFTATEYKEYYRK